MIMTWKRRMLKPRIYMCFSKMMRLQNKWSNVLWLEALCYFKIVIFWNLTLCFHLVQSLLYEKIWNFMWIHPLLCFHICQFENFSQLGSVVLRFFTLWTFCPWNSFCSTLCIFTNFIGSLSYQKVVLQNILCGLGYSY